MSVPQRHNREESAGPRSAGRILIMSKDDALRSSLQLYFEGEYAVSSVASCEEAAEALRRVPADLLLLDVGLFDEGAEELVTSLHAVPRRVAVVLMYVYREALRAWEQRIRRDVDAVCYKPVDVSQLADRIREILYNR